MKRHAVLTRQLRHANLTEEACPKELNNWHRFLDRVNRAYQDLDQERYLSERLQQVSAREMERLFSQLKEKENYLQTVLDNTIESVITTDASGKIETFNAKSTELFGYTEEVILGENILRLLPQNLHNHYKAMLTAPLDIYQSTSTSSPKEITALHQNGHVFPAELSISDELVNEKQTFFWLFRDITSEVLAKKREDKLNKELIFSAHLAGMTEVATSVIHSAGNILNSIGVSATLLKEKLTGSKFISGFTQVSEAILKHKHDLINFLSQGEQAKNFVAYLDLLNKYLQNQREEVQKELETLLSNIDHIKEIIREQQSLNVNKESIVEPVMLEKKLRKAVELVGFNENYHITYDCQIHKEIRLDRIRVIQILVNLLQNSKDSLKQAETKKRKEINIKASIKKKVICVEIKDNGIGFSKEAAKKIFMADYTTKKSGHGYGLHISSLLAKNLGGSLKGVSEGTNRGATFTLTLPYQSQEEGGSDT